MFMKFLRFVNNYSQSNNDCTFSLQQEWKGKINAKMIFLKKEKLSICLAEKIFMFMFTYQHKYAANYTNSKW